MPREKSEEQYALEAFISTLSHDLRAPLSVIKISAALILQDVHLNPNDDERIRYRIKIIQRQATVMFRMINTLLDAEKIAAGHLPIEKKEVDAVADVFEVLEEFIPIATARNVLIDVVIPERPVISYYDRDRIRQVLGNLVSNALKFAKEGTTCTISLLREKECVRFEVLNIGEVISEDKRKLIFEKFYRGTYTNGEDNINSSGLGLWIARWIVTEHGGEIWVESETSLQRNRFCFTIPHKPESSSSKDVSSST